jgi:hypothetical protein
MTGYHEMKSKEFARLRIEKARRLAGIIDGPMKAPEIARRAGVVLQTAHTLLDEAIRQGFVEVVGEKAKGKACIFVRADAPAAHAEAARESLDRAGQARARVLAACPASGYAPAADVMAAARLPHGAFRDALRELAGAGRIEAPARRSPLLLGLAGDDGPVGHPGVARVDAVDLFDHLNPLRLRIVQIIDGIGIASARQVRAVMDAHGFELPGTLDAATAIPAEAKSGWVRILREEGVWQVRFELTDMGRRVASEAHRTRPLPDLAADRAPGP